MRETRPADKSVREIVVAYWAGAPEGDPYRTPFAFRAVTVGIFIVAVVVLTLLGASLVVAVVASVVIFVAAQIAFAAAIVSRQGRART